MIDDRYPRSRDWAIPFGLAVMLGLFYMSTQMKLQMSMFVLALTVMFFAWSAMNWLHQVARIVSDIRNENKSVDFKLSENFLAEKVASMNEVQIRAMKSGRVLLELFPGNNGPVEKLYGEEVYLYTAWHILVNSNERNVYPINRFQSGTFHFDLLGDHAVDDNQQARNFHWWLVRYGFAKWSRGNESATWVSGASPENVMGYLGLTKDSYKDE